MKNKRIIKRLIIVIVALVLVAPIYYAGKIVWIKKIGINIQPTKSHQVVEVPFYLQNDPSWAEDQMGRSSTNMAESGCLVSSIASSLKNFEIEKSPQEVNQIFSVGEVYTSSGEVIWMKINKTIPEIDYSYKRFFGSKALEKDLSEGKLPIVKVRYNKWGIYHWVLIVGATEDEFLIMDPLNPDKQPSPLSTHGRVYAYRVLEKIEQ